MTQTDYYNALGLSSNSSVEEIKKAYRIKARLYHPDINPSPEAKDLFIAITEAYDFLISNHEKINTNDEAYKQAMEDWRKYRQDRSHKRAKAYSGTSYNKFKSTNFYKTTRIFDGTTFIISLLTSIMIIASTIFGYFYRLRHPIPGDDGPSVFSFLMLLAVGMIFLFGSLIFFKEFQASSKNQKKKSKTNDKTS
jgi:curved DNA-binding protein CbpA